jgi:lysozyme
MNKDNWIVVIVFTLLIIVVVGSIFYKKHSNHFHPTRRLNGAKVYVDKRISKYDIHGIDVSHHQGNINWKKVIHPDTSKSIDFVFIRSTVGTRKDRHFKRNWRRARNNGYAVGAYHYYWANLNSTVQANNFINTVTLKKGDFPPILDIEKLSKVQSLSKLRTGLKNWISIVEKHYGVKPIIYTGDSFYMNYLRVDPYFRNYPRLWIANYNRVSSPISNWLFWQFTDRVRIKGINEMVDMNVFHGDADKLNLLKLK